MWHIETPSLEWDVLRGHMSGEDIPTAFDLSSIWNLSDQELLSKVEAVLRVKLSEYSSIVMLNRLFWEALKYLKEELFYTDKEIGKMKETIFHTSDDVIQFLRKTKTHRGMMYCVITKVSQAIHNSYSQFNQRVKIVKEKTEWVIQDKLLLPLRVEKINQDEIRGTEFIEEGNGKIMKIPYKIKRRIKSDASSTSKEIRDPKCFTIDKASDLYGMTFEVYSKDHILPLMQYISGFVFKKADFEVKNDKGMFTQDEIEDSLLLRDEFKAKILQWTKKRDKPESGDVQDIKLVSPLEKGKEIENMSLEIKFVLEENRNEEGLNMHGVYNYMKKISERIRLEWYVDHQYLEKVAEKFLENLENILHENSLRPEKDGDTALPYKEELFRALRDDQNAIPKNVRLRRNQHVISNIDKYLHEGLVSYFKSRFIPVYRGESQRQVYYTNKRALKMSKGWLGVKLTPLSL